jgi:hypothetical protein
MTDDPTQLAPTLTLGGRHDVKSVISNEDSDGDGAGANMKYVNRPADGADSSSKLGIGEANDRRAALKAKSVVR